MGSGLIVVKGKGQVIPDSLLSVATKPPQSNYGVAWVQGDAIRFINGKVKADGDKLTMDEWKAHQLSPDVKAEAIYAIFDTEAEIKDEDLQPFVLLGKADAADLVCFADGSFERYFTEGSGRTNASLMVEKRLKTKIEKLFNSAGKNLKPVLEELKGNDLQEDIKEMLYPDGTVAFLFKTGEVINITSNKNARAYSFGFTTNSFGLKEDSFPKVETTPPKGKLSSAVSTTTADAAKTEDKATMADARAQVSSADAAATGTQRVWVKPKTSVETNKLGKLYYDVCKAVEGTVPSKEKRGARPAVETTQASYIRYKNQLDLVDPASQYRPMAADTPQPPEESTLIGDKLKEAQKSKDTAATHVSVVMPTITPDQLKLLREFRAKVKPLPDEDMEKIAAKLNSPFVMPEGITLGEAAKFTPDAWVDFCKANNTAAGHTIWWAVQDLHKIMKTLPKSLRNQLDKAA